MMYYEAKMQNEQIASEALSVILGINSKIRLFKFSRIKDMVNSRKETNGKIYFPVKIVEKIDDQIDHLSDILSEEKKILSKLVPGGKYLIEIANGSFGVYVWSLHHRDNRHEINGEEYFEAPSNSFFDDMMFLQKPVADRKSPFNPEKSLMTAQQKHVIIEAFRSEKYDSESLYAEILASHEHIKELAAKWSEIEEEYFRSIDRSNLDKQLKDILEGH